MGKKLIIVGGGIAGVSAAHAARSEYPDADITLISEEPYPFYNKIALNSYAIGDKKRDHLGFYPLGELESADVTELRGKRALSLNPDLKKLVCSDGTEFGYDSLILSTGAVPSLPEIPGIDSEGVYPMWSLKEAMTLRGALGTAKRIFVLGAGVLGVEIALALAEAGKEVTLCASRDRVMPRILGTQAAGPYETGLREAGVNVLLSRKVDRIQGAPGNMTVTAGGETWNTDAVLAFTGAAPDAVLAAEAGLECGRGIKVDAAMHTSVPNILACGNCIETEGGGSLLWNPAKRQGQIAGRNAFEERQAGGSTPETIHIKAPALPLFACGPATEPDEGLRILSDGDESSYRELRLDSQGKIVSALFVRNVSGCYDVEQAILKNSVIPESLIDSGNINAVLISLKLPRLSQKIGGRAWVCDMCGYIYEGDDPPELCPVCSVGKDQFKAA